MTTYLGTPILSLPLETQNSLRSKKHPLESHELETIHSGGSPHSPLEGPRSIGLMRLMRLMRHFDADVRGHLVPQNIDKDSKHLELHLRTPGDALAPRDGGNEMGLDDVDPRVEVHLEAAFQGQHPGDGVDGRLNGLLVHHGPEAVLATSEMVGDQGGDEDAGLGGG